LKKLSVHQRASFLGDAVFAASDGIVTTFAIVAGSEGASLGNSVVLILGFANLFADGISMAAGRFLGVKSEIDFEEAKGRRTDVQVSPFKHAFLTFVFFNLAGLVPLIPFIFGQESSFVLSSFLVAIALIGVGVLKNVYTKNGVIKSIFEILLVGGFAAIAAFFIGYVIENYIL